MADTNIPTKRIFFKLGNRVYEVSEDLAAQWIENGNATAREEFTVRKGHALALDDEQLEVMNNDCRVVFYGDWKNGSC